MRVKRVFATFLIALILVGVVAAQNSYTGGNIGYTSYVPSTPPSSSSWDPNAATCVASTGTPNTIAIPSVLQSIGISILALTISVDIIAIGFILSRIVPATGIRNWLSNEYWELAKSALVIVIVYAAISFVANMSVLFTGSTAGTTFGNIGTLVTQDNLYICNSQIYAQATWNFIGIMSNAIGILQNTKVAFWLPIPIPIPPDDPEGGFAFEFGFGANIYQNFLLETGNVVIQHFESAVYDLTQFIAFPTTLILDGLGFLLPLLVDVGLGILIPFGLIMRAFPFIRGIGGTLIAIGIGLALVYPAILALFNAPISSAMSTFVLAQPPAQLSCSPGGSIASLPSELICKDQLILGNIFGNAASLFYYGWNAFFGIYPFYNNMLSYTIYLIVQLILFAFDIVIVYTITDNIAKSLGGTIRLSLGSKIRLM